MSASWIANHFQSPSIYHIALAEDMLTLVLVIQGRSVFVFSSH